MLAVQILLVFTLPALAHSPALRAYESGDHNRAFQLWMQEAKSGDRESQYHLALLYRDGQGVAKDLAEALHWLRRSAESGYAPSQTTLGGFLASGTGTPVDFAEAGSWYEKASAQGNVRARNQLGLLYLNGRGVQQDFGRAFQLFFEASGESKPAAYNIGLMYERGLGRKQDPVEAAAWYSIATDMGEPGALAKQFEVAKKFSPAEDAALRSRIRDITFQRFLRELKWHWADAIAVIGCCLAILQLCLTIFGSLAKNSPRPRDREMERNFTGFAGSGWKRWFLLYQPQGTASLGLRIVFFTALVFSIATWIALFVSTPHLNTFMAAVCITSFLPALRWAAISFDKRKTMTHSPRLC